MLKAIHAKCSGCRACLMACAIVNHREVNPTLAALTVTGYFPDPGGYRIGLCDQCGECAQACPVEAITVQEGVFAIEAEICTGCESCIEVCPNQVMGMHPATAVAFMCTTCGECAEICPRGALLWESPGALTASVPSPKEVAS